MKVKLAYNMYKMLSGTSHIDMELKIMKLDICPYKMIQNHILINVYHEMNLCEATIYYIVQ
jgi:hypothetical protein